MDAAVLNSRVTLEVKKGGKGFPEPTGDATEIGINRYFNTVLRARAGMDIEAFRAANYKVFEIPFNSANKWQMSIHEIGGIAQKQVMFIKVFSVNADEWACIFSS